MRMHGMSKTIEYRAWFEMRRRCYDQDKLIKQLKRAYESDNIKTIYDTGYITTVTKDNTKYYVLSTYCRK